MEFLQHLDEQVFLYLNNLGNPTWDWFWLLLTKYWISLPIYGLVTYLIYRKTGLKEAVITVTAIGLMVIIAYYFTDVIKSFVRRPRPCGMDLEMRFLVDNCSGYSFYSRHSAIALALAILVGYILKPFYRYAPFWMILWALLMGYSRIYVGKHYPGDVLVGFLVGIITGLIFYKAHQYVIKRVGSYNLRLYRRFKR